MIRSRKAHYFRMSRLLDKELAHCSGNLLVAHFLRQEASNSSQLLQELHPSSQGEASLEAREAEFLHKVEVSSEMLQQQQEALSSAVVHPSSVVRTPFSEPHQRRKMTGTVIMIMTMAIMNH